MLRLFILDSDECVDGQRRIVRDRSGLKGRVEVCFNGLWGAAYSVSTWGTSQVSIICKGYEPSGIITCNVDMKFSCQLSSLL